MSNIFLLDPLRILPMHCTTDSLLNNLVPLYWVHRQVLRQNWKRIHNEDMLVLKMDASKLIANQVACAIISAMCVAFYPHGVEPPRSHVVFQ